MAETMRAMYLHAAGDVREHRDPVPEVRDPQEVLIKLAAIGVCGSDCHFFERGRIGSYVVKDPVILGHECSGTVVAVGAEVRHLAVADAVCVEPGIPCGRCARCREGRYNICEEQVVFMGTPPWHGAFREYLTWPADLVFRLPAGVSLEDGAMVEPLAVGVHACHRGGVRPGQTTAVLGAGPIGLLAAQAAAAFGASPVVCTDVVPSRLARARQLGLQAVEASPTEVVAEVRARCNEVGPDVVIETAGTAETMHQAMRMVRTGGVVVLVGMPPVEEAVLPVMDQLVREYDVRSVFRYANAYLPALALIASGKVQLAPLRTHRFGLAETEAALRQVIEHKAETMKVIVQP
jgi:L-iditol 2-dehydrogenase